MNKKKSKAQKKKKALKKQLKKMQAEALSQVETEKKVKKQDNTKTQKVFKVVHKKKPKKKVETRTFYDQEKELDYIPPKHETKAPTETDALILPKLNKDKTVKEKNKSRAVAKKEDVFSKIGEWFSSIGEGISKKIAKRRVTSIKKKRVEQLEYEPELPEKARKVPKNPVLKVLFYIHENLYILFDTALIITFIILILGMNRVLVIPSSTIKYIACIVGFLGIVAISLNKYISGRIFSLFLLAGMIGGIYYLNYTYDFINNFNEKLYEYREYYVVAIDNGRNKSIYNINNKRVGLLNDNSTNVERVLNTKLENVKYKTYTDQEKLYIDFINNEYRAIVVKENQFKYIKNNNINPDIKIKILYKFKVNCKKET